MNLHSTKSPSVPSRSEGVPPGKGSIWEGVREIWDSMLYYNRKLKNTARTLHKNMTDSEKLLWSRIRRRQLKGYQFYRQKIINNYVVDFYCPSAKMIIEVDGSQHSEARQRRKDKERDAELSKLGFEVIRFWSWVVMKNIDEVVDEIWNRLD
jgi:very-short-patch-repair endonuclease